MAQVSRPDLTAIYYTSEEAPDFFRASLQVKLLEALDGLPLVVVKKPADIPRSQAQIYRQVLQGAKEATTDFIACCEDDVLYSPEHFKFRPKDGYWGYNMNAWSLFTWGETLFSYKAPGGRRNLNGLICERKMLIEHLEERFKLWPDDSKIDIRIFGEPGKYDNQLGTTPYPSQDFYINPPNIVFSHEANLQFKGLGYRKGLGQIRATEVPYWGKAEELRKLYSTE